METSKLRKFAQFARRTLVDQVEAKLALVLSEGSAARRESQQAVIELEKQVAAIGQPQLIEKVAYTWFNRFCALRFMDVNEYTRIRVVSPADEGQFQPEILAEAKAGHIDAERVSEKARAQITALLDGSATSRDPQQEAYRLLIVAECNSFHRAMPYLFERIADYTELLMPDDLLSGNSILAYTREAMTPDACKDVEVIGWLYQFYISEKKDEVFEGLKKAKKITPENIPAATQLFTPHWIVRYLVENSLGRLWMLNHPNSGLIKQMDYYIRPEQPETDFLHIAKPEDIKVCDPACGSGHMLTYAFDLLYAIYEEAGTDASEIPAKILTHNLYGIELDERAGDLAAFALSMKARSKQKRFFSKSVAPNICVLEKISFGKEELADYVGAVGRDLFTVDLRETLTQFEEADNFGSLIRPALENTRDVLPVLEAKNFAGQLFLKDTHDKVLMVLRQADYLSPKYQVVIANPPYMGARGMNGRLAAWAKQFYPDSKNDLFAMFIERNRDLVVSKGAVGMITMQSWMFLSSFENLRETLLRRDFIISMAHLGARAFDSIGGEVVSTTAFVLERSGGSKRSSSFIRLVDGKSELEKDVAIRAAIESNDCDWRFSISASDLQSIPGTPIAYWVRERELQCLKVLPKMSAYATSSNGVQTGNNAAYVRRWSEVAASKLKSKWIPYSKGGPFRRWYGNYDYVVNWENDGEAIKAEKNFCARGEEFYLTKGITWSDITSGSLSARLLPEGFIFDASGPSAFFEDKSHTLVGLALLNTQCANHWSKIFNPTLHFQSGDFRKLPLSERFISDRTSDLARRLIAISKRDWDSSEEAMDFTGLALLDQSLHGFDLDTSYQNVRLRWEAVSREAHQLEVENNANFIDAYGLQDEMTPEVAIGEVSLICNPHYRYGSDKSGSELQALQLTDAMRDLFSYAVGCMFGRYSLDMPGLVLANQGETLADYLRRVPDPRFTPDEDNVIPLLDGEWFTDDVTERFQSFLRAAFGEERYVQNMRFIEDAIGKDIRKYFLRDFYTDHFKRYKKRPIYWLFSSPKGSFNALIYLHRYRPDTVSVVLQYLRDFRTKLTARRSYLEQISISSSASQTEKTKALKEIDALKKQLVELDDYERDTLYPLAAAQLPLDLDDGVKVNYLKLGAALKKIPGLDAKDED